MVGIICPPPVGIGLTDLPNIGGASGPPGPPQFRHHCPLLCGNKPERVFGLQVRYKKSENFFGRNFFGGFFLGGFFGRIFCEDFFGRNFLFSLLKSAKLFESLALKNSCMSAKTVKISF